MKLTIVFLMVTIGLSAYAQRIAEIDLTQLPIDRLQKGALIQRDLIPQECMSPELTTSDGEILSPATPATLRIQLVLDEKHLAIGDHVGGEVVMQNVGPDEVIIPWTIDLKALAPKLNLLQHEYDEGWFEVELKGEPPVRLESESVSAFLYGSSSAPGTTLLLKPGEWVVAKFGFVIAQDRKSSVSLRFPTGKTEAVVRWRQVRHGWRRQGCQMESSYHNYDYAEETEPARIEVWNRPLTVIP